MILQYQQCSALTVEFYISGVFEAKVCYGQKTKQKPVNKWRGNDRKSLLQCNPRCSNWIIQGSLIQATTTDRMENRIVTQSQEPINEKALGKNTLTKFIKHYWK